MNLMGVTAEYTYTWPSQHLPKAPDESGKEKDDREYFPWPQPGKSRCLLPWRESVYKLPPCFSDDHRERTCGPAKSVPAPAQPQPPSQPSHEASAPSPARDKNMICCNAPTVPYRRVIVGGKLRILPDKEKLKSVKFDPCIERHAVSPDICLQPEVKDPPTLPVIGRDPDLPMTPPLGRTARLQAFIRAREDEAAEKVTRPRAPCFPSSPFYTARHPTAPEKQAEERKRLSESKVIDPPMSTFPHDTKALSRSARVYKNDKALQIERGQYEDPRKWSDEGAKEWYSSMMLKDGPGLDAKTESQLQRSDCIRVPDRLGGHCYICPHQQSGPAHRSELEPNSAQSQNPNDCGNIFKSSVPKPPPCKQKLIQQDIDSIIHSTKKLATERDELYQQLVDTEEPLHQAKQVYYSSSYEQRRANDSLLLRICSIENTQKSLVEAIRNKGRELTQLLIEQHALECHLTQQIIQDGRQKHETQTHTNQQH